AGFRNPPHSAGVNCFWWWLNGNVTKEAITRDLEEMKDKGFNGALIFDADGSGQQGNRRMPDGNCILNLEDFAVIAATWLDGPKFEELAVMAEKWLTNYSLSTSLADDGRYNELFSALTALKDHITGTTPLDASQIEAHKLTIDANSELVGDNGVIIDACFNLVETYDTEIGPLWVTGSPIQSFTRSSTTNDIHWAVYNVMQYIMDSAYTKQNILSYKDLFDGFKFGSSADFPGAVEPPADPEATHTVTINASFLKTFGRDTMGWLS
ncbi:unnamed protein product, partial [marine sediment metagenome]